MSCFFGHSVRGRFNAWFLHTIENHIHRHTGKRKRKLFEDLPCSAVELGPGTGANFRYYRAGTVLTAIEPNLMMHSRLRRNAEQYGINLDIRGLKKDGLGLDLASESTEAVISTLVLCSVGNQRQVLNEVHRILRPGGRFLFLEHVAARRGTLMRYFQDLIRQPWQWCFEGCDPICETGSALKEAGFSKIELENFEVKSLIFAAIKHHIAGIATK